MKGTIKFKFNYQKEKAKFEADWQREEKLLRSQNVSEEVVAEIYQLSLEQFRSNRNYYLHKDEFSNELDINEEIDLEEFIGLVESIENPKLLKGLLSLSEDEMNLIKLHYVQKLSLSDISSLENEKFDTVRKRLYRTKNKLKKYF